MASRGGQTKTYRIWSGVKSRCTNPRATGFKDYGGKGVSVCDRWLVFGNFLADMGECPSDKHSLDRIDNAKGYEPENCRWLLRSLQNRNRTTNRIIVANGVTATMAEWAEKTGLTPEAIRTRLNRGWTGERAINTPMRLKRNPSKSLRESTKGIWYEMVRRCTNPKDLSYPNYGGRGVQVCGRWAGSFDLFVADVGERPSFSHSIDRIDNEKGYEPSNCRWATSKEQAANQRRRLAKTAS